MKAAVLTGEAQGLTITDVPEPEPAAGEVVVEVDACGICGSDLHSLSKILPAGSVMGHEIAGRIVELGPGVDAASCGVGTRVAVRPFTGCDACDWCDKGRADHCSSFALVGQQRPGGYAERVSVSSHEIYRMPAGVTGPEQALVEPLAIARRALRRGAMQPGEDVLVLGGGPIGLAVAVWARALGAGRILVSEPAEVRRDLAMGLGADVAVDPTSVDLGAAIQETFGGLPSLVMECTGAPGVIGQSFLHTAIDGRVVVVGICMANDQIFPWFAMERELDLRFTAFYGRDDYVDTLARLDDGGLQTASMITQTIGLDDVPARFARMLETPDAGKVIIVP